MYRCHPPKLPGSPHCQYLQSLRVESHAAAWSRRVRTRDDVAGRGGKQRAEAPELAESVEWVRRAAEGGLGLAMSRLAAVLRNGKGVPRDDAAAALWYRQVSRGLKTGIDGGLGGRVVGLVPAFRPTEPIGWRGRLHGELGLLSLSLSLHELHLRLPAPVVVTVVAGDRRL